MKEKEFIVAIELGSSAIRGIAGCRKPDGGVQVERIAQVPTGECVHRGVIYNIDKTTTAIRQIRESLEKDLQLQITQVYVGIQGQSVRTIKNFVRETFDQVREVTDADIDSLLTRNSDTNYGDMEILEVIPQEYKLDHKEEDDPKGVETRTIEGRFNNVVARTKVRENILKCLQNAGLRCAGIILSPMAIASHALTDQERRSGCALVDFGAETTTVQVYKGGKLRYLATLPIGGRSITHDIATAKDIDEQDAETLKLSHGVAIIDLSKDIPTAELPITGDRTFPLALIERICEARTEEIIRNVNECIRRSEVAEQLTSGFILTGAAARMSELPRAFTSFFPSQNKVHLAHQLLSSDELMRCGYGLQGGNYDALVSILAQGEEICTQPIPEPNPEPQMDDLFNQPQEPTTDINTKEEDDDDDTEKKPKPSILDKWKKTASRLWQQIGDSLDE